MTKPYRRKGTTYYVQLLNAEDYIEKLLKAVAKASNLSDLQKSLDPPVSLFDTGELQVVEVAGSRRVVDTRPRKPR
jgi:hypothetical protein